MKRKRKEYAFYNRHDEVEIVGNAQEIAEYLSVTPGTIRTVLCVKDGKIRGGKLYEIRGGDDPQPTNI